ncbi:hypothetical protein [Phycicoccus endophyticus]|uniref:hypothetical protein n=1 Tax=Phycicoccus endophyticus TaxID=1690220 RepID=UPI0021CE9549|nr:hypothetical protein [Phycicoccus endophyticus]
MTAHPDATGRALPPWLVVTALVLVAANLRTLMASLPRSPRASAPTSASRARPWGC